MKQSFFTIICLITLLHGISIGNIPIDSTGLLGYWPFEEGIGFVVEDNMNGHLGQMYGQLERVAGKIGAGLDFDGYDDIVRTNSSFNQDGSVAVTLAAWVYPKEISFKSQHIISSDNGAWDWSILIDKGQWVIFTGENNWFTGIEVEVNKWYHVAAVFEPSHDIYFYLNGEVIHRGKAPVPDQNTNNTAFGENPGGWVQPFEGIMDEVYIFERALSHQEIISLMQVQQPQIEKIEIEGPSYLVTNKKEKYAAIGIDSEGNRYDLSWVYDWSTNNDNVVCELGGYVQTNDLSAPVEDLIVSLTPRDPNYPEVSFETHVFSLCPSLSCLRFLGTNNFVEIPHNGIYNLQDGLTLEAWIKPDAEQMTGNSRIICKLLHPHNGYDLNIHNYGEHRLQFEFKGSDGQYKMIRGVTRLNDDQWHHVAATYDGIALKLYVDGKLEGVTQIENDIFIQNNKAPIRIGQTPNEPENQSFRGNIAEARIWNIALTAEEIYSRMYTILDGSEEGLIGYWPLNEGQGGTAFDYSAYANHGSLGINPDLIESRDPIWVDSAVPVGFCSTEEFIQENLFKSILLGRDISSSNQKRINLELDAIAQLLELQAAGDSDNWSSKQIQKSRIEIMALVAKQYMIGKQASKTTDKLIEIIESLQE